MFDNVEIDYVEGRFETLEKKVEIESELGLILNTSCNLKSIFSTKAGTNIYEFKYTDLDYSTLKKIEEYLSSITV